jgi:hypothetical protein
VTLEDWRAIPPAAASIFEWPGAVRRLQPVGATTYVDGSAGGLRYGRVVWGTELASQLAGISWDWREVRANVLALADPMAVQSNVVLFDDAGRPIRRSATLLFLNRAIHSLPWQQRIWSRAG